MDALSDLKFLFEKDRVNSCALMFGAVAEVLPEQLEVVLDGEAESTPAVRACSAEVGDRVVCLLSSAGTLVAVAEEEPEELAPEPPVTEQDAHFKQDVQIDGDLAVQGAIHGAVATESWKPLELLNDWAHYGTQFAEPSYYKDALGRVHLRGTIGGGTNAYYTPLARLPEGYRPQAYEYFAVATSEGAGTVYVIGDGRVIIHRPEGATWFSLSGISFRAV